jgi:hypothetical protein
MALAVDLARDGEHHQVEVVVLVALDSIRVAQSASAQLPRCVIAGPTPAHRTRAQIASP